MESEGRLGWETPPFDSFNASEDVSGTQVVPTMTGNVSANMSEQVVPFHGGNFALMASISAMVFLVGLVGNTLAVYVVLRYVKMKTVTNIYILNLALADEMYILGLPFMSTQNLLLYWPFGSFMCRMVLTADALNQFTSIFCLTVMSIDRYLAVVHPIRSSRWRRPRVAKVVSVALWATSFIVVLPVVIFSEVQEQVRSCNFNWPEPRNLWSAAFILYTSVLGFFGPLLVICACYMLIVVRVKASGARTGLGRRRRSERKVTRMVVVIVVAFVICWLPFFILNLVNLVIILPENSVIYGVYSFAVILSYCNSCANPVLYGFLSDNFRQSFQKLLCFRRANGVEDTEASAPRTDKTTAVYGFLPLRSNHINGHAQRGQVCPQTPTLPNATTASGAEERRPAVESPAHGPQPES